MSLTTSQLCLVAIAGICAGVINGIVGAGTLITFPILVALGIPPVLANGTNTTGLFPGAITSAVVYRHHLKRNRRLIVAMSAATLLMAALGAGLVLALPSSVFDHVIPVLILIAVGLVLVQPVLTKAVKNAIGTHTDAGFPHRVPSVATAAGVGVYGGYFGGGQGVVYMALLPLFYEPDLQESNAVKNVLAAVANATASVVFIVAGRVLWVPALILMGSSIVGGWVGGRLAKRLPQLVLRIVIAVVGITAAVTLFLR